MPPLLRKPIIFPRGFNFSWMEDKGHVFREAYGVRGAAPLLAVVWFESRSKLHTHHASRHLGSAIGRRAGQRAPYPPLLLKHCLVTSWIAVLT
jgi:hypothetical protein